jgi:uncharacterized protein
MRIIWQRVVGLFLLAVVTGAVPAAAQELDPSLRSDIVKLMEVTGAARMGEQMAGLVSNQMLDVFQKTHPDAPPRCVDVIREVLGSEFAAAFSAPDGLVARLIPIYAKHFDQEEVRGLIAFYESELGRKTVGVMPRVMQESALVGQQWGAEIMPRVEKTLRERLKAEGFEE